MHDRLRALAARPWAMEPAALQALLAGDTPAERLAVIAADQRAAASAIQAAARALQPVGPGARGLIMVLPLLGFIDQRPGWFTGVDTIGFGHIFRQAVEDPAIGAIVLDVDSPGGSVFGVGELSAQIFAARGAKPIVAVSNSVMASAAYWIASAADEVVAAPGSLTGSIGVYAAHVNAAEAYKAMGVEITLVGAGKYKVERNDSEPLGDVARAALQAEVDHYYGAFVDAVARNRGVKAAAVRGGFGEGRLLVDRAAMDAGLVDTIATRDEVLAALLKRLGGPGAQPSARRADMQRRLTLAAL